LSSVFVDRMRSSNATRSTRLGHCGTTHLDVLSLTIASRAPWQIRLPVIFRRPRNPLFYIGAWLPYIFVYQATNRFPIIEPRELPYTSVDVLVPFVPALMPLYLLYFPLYWWTAVRSETDEVAMRLFYASYFQLGICALFFVFFPICMPSGVIPTSEAGGWADAAWRWFDGPNNCFPSLHAANGLLLLHFNWTRSKRWMHTAVAAGVVMSTVLVKQHYVVDVIAGAAVYGAAAVFLARLHIVPSHRGATGK
jgi:hypothetical protein